MTEYSTEEYRGYTIKVYYDDYPENPRNWDGNIATFVCERHCYVMGDVHDVEGETNSLFEKYVETDAIIEYFKKHNNNVRLVNNEDGKFYTYDFKGYTGLIETIFIDANDGDDDVAATMADSFTIEDKLRLVEESGKVVIQTINMYDHSGCSVWLGGTDGHIDTQWDYGVLGFAYIEWADAEKRGATTPGPDGKYKGYNDWKAWANAKMEAEMELYNDYISGNVYGYKIEDGEGDFEDSCWGFYGDDCRKEMLEECRGIIDDHIEKVAEKRKADMELLIANLDNMIGSMFVESDFLYRVGRDPFGLACLQKASIVKKAVKAFDNTKITELSNDMLDKMVATIKSHDDSHILSELYLKHKK